MSYLSPNCYSFLIVKGAFRYEFNALDDGQDELLEMLKHLLYVSISLAFFQQCLIALQRRRITRNDLHTYLQLGLGETSIDILFLPKHKQVQAAAQVLAVPRYNKGESSRDPLQQVNR